jgi:hypothetical protein
MAQLAESPFAGRHVLPSVRLSWQRSGDDRRCPPRWQAAGNRGGPPGTGKTTMVAEAKRIRRAAGLAGARPRETWSSSAPTPRVSPGSCSSRSSLPSAPRGGPTCDLSCHQAPKNKGPLPGRPTRLPAQHVERGPGVRRGRWGRPPGPQRGIRADPAQRDLPRRHGHHRVPDNGAAAETLPRLNVTGPGAWSPPRSAIRARQPKPGDLLDRAGQVTGSADLAATTPRPATGARFEGRSESAGTWTRRLTNGQATLPGRPGCGNESTASAGIRCVCAGLHDG